MLFQRESPSIYPSKERWRASEEVQDDVYGKIDSKKLDMPRRLPIFVDRCQEWPIGYWPIQRCWSARVPCHLDHAWQETRRIVLLYWYHALRRGGARFLYSQVLVIILRSQCQVILSSEGLFGKGCKQNSTALSLHLSYHWMKQMSWWRRTMEYSMSHFKLLITNTFLMKRIFEATRYRPNQTLINQIFKELVGCTA